MDAEQIDKGLSDDDKAILRENATSGRLYADTAAQMLKNDDDIAEIRRNLGEPQ